MLELLIILGFAAATLGGWQVWNLRPAARAIDKARGEVARSLGLHYRPGTAIEIATIHGAINEHPVAVKWGVFEGVIGTKYEVDGLEELQIRPVPFGTKAGRILGVGGRHVDRLLENEVIECDAFNAVALNDPEVQRRARSVLDMGAQTYGTKLRLIVSGDDPPDVAQAKLLVLTAFAEALRSRREQPARFLASAVGEDWGGTEALRVMTRELRGLPETIDAGRALEDASDSELRMLGAIARDDHAEVRSLALEATVPSASRIEGLEYLLARHPGSVDADFERWLLTMLSGDELSRRLVAAKALAQAGTVAAVEPLRQAGEPLLADGDLKRAAKEAVASIQARQPEAGYGQLAIVPGSSEGALSEAPSTGALSPPLDGSAAIEEGPKD